MKQQKILQKREDVKNLMPEQCCLNGILCETFYKYPQKCALCFEQAYYIPEKQKTKKKYTGKNSNRMGARFEKENHEANQKLLATSNQTPNSGAGKIKGDEQISGIIHVMEELKTKVKPKISRGSEVFTVHKEWLTKLATEASQENKEFWYLKFRFYEPETDTYVVVSQDMIMSMIKTMAEDRKKAKTAQYQIDMANAKAELLNAENTMLRAKIRLQEAEVNLLHDRLGEENSPDCQEN
jgi:hypothetical protein